MELTDAQYERIAPLLPKARGSLKIPHRQALNTLLQAEPSEGWSSGMHSWPCWPEGCALAQNQSLPGAVYGRKESGRQSFPGSCSTRAGGSPGAGAEAAAAGESGKQVPAERSPALPALSYAGLVS